MPAEVDLSQKRWLSSDSPRSRDSIRHSGGSRGTSWEIRASFARVQRN
jgi:hypothetical protein